VKSVELSRMLRVAAAFGLAVAGAFHFGGIAPAQQAEKGVPANPKDVYQQFRGHLSEGKFDIAALFLQSFVDSKPSDQDLFDIEARYGSTVFSQLRTLRKWSDDPKVDATAKANVELLNKMLKDATDKLLKDPGRVNKFIRNLGESYEEKEFAKFELKRTGDFAIPYMVEAFRANLNPAVTSGIVETIPKLNGDTLAGWIAALDGMTPDQQFVVLSKIIERDDILNLIMKVQTDIRPYLWRLAGQDASPPLKQFALDVLGKVVTGASKKQPESELVAAARVFADHKGTYLGVAAAGDGSPSLVPVWTWNDATKKLELNANVAAGQADEYYGLRYARWALDKSPDFEPAQALMLSIAAERAMDRGKFADLSRTDPNVYKLLADAPSTVLADLLARGIAEKRTGVVLALTQVTGDRAEKGSAGLLEKALDYGDPRVQLAAASALLRAPTPPSDRVRVKIVEVLRRAAGADPNALPETKGQALIADPNRQRADDAAVYFRALGYETEIFTNGRDLLKRTSRASDFDIVLIDHHLPNPELGDVIANLRADTRAARRPILVVASTSQPTPPTIDQLLLRFALLIAATETDPIGMPAPFVPDPKKPEEQQAIDRKTTQERRDDVFRTTMVSRMERLQRVLDTSGIELSDAQKYQLKLRSEQITAAVLAAEYPLSAESAPRAYSNYLALLKQIGIQPSVPAYKRRVGVDHLMKLIERLETDVAKHKPSGDKYEMLRGRVDAEMLGLNVEPARDAEAEARLSKQFRNVASVRVVPEAPSRTWLEADVNAAFQNPADRPRDTAEKKAAAKLAVSWLSKMATGEVKGFDAKAAAKELIDALGSEDLAEAAIDGVSRFPTAEAQQELITSALRIGRALPVRVKSADAAIRHVQMNGKLVAKPLIDGVIDLSGKEMDADLRAKLLVLKGLLAPNAKDYITGLKAYSPPLAPPPMMPMPPAPVPEPKPKGE
jgi:CheY-like chemotaxis protein